MQLEHSMVGGCVDYVCARRPRTRNGKHTSDESKLSLVSFTIHRKTTIGQSELSLAFRTRSKTETKTRANFVWLRAKQHTLRKRLKNIIREL